MTRFTSNLQKHFKQRTSIVDVTLAETIAFLNWSSIYNLQSHEFMNIMDICVVVSVFEKNKKLHTFCAGAIKKNVGV